MRGALFTMLGELDGLTVLDAFAGSGALSFEAVSHGAVSALAIESDRNAQKTIARNIQSLGLGAQIKLVSATANAWLNTNADASFDIVLCDPPYDNVQEALIMRLARLVKPNGLLVLSWPGNAELPQLPDLSLVEQRSYGDAQLGFFRNNT